MPGRGLIPAHAGKTSTGTAKPPPPGAHPRSRGENDVSTGKQRRYVGSSPLTRGKHSDDGADGRRMGLIPAHAGKTSRAQAASSPFGAHPRSRGENSLTETAQQIDWGSSPLTRGKLRAEANNDTNAGLIPAHAGKTSGGHSRPGPRGAHPRSRGENASAVLPFISTTGSSPLTRGKLSPYERARDFAGLIPAHAGKTLGLRRERRPRRAHPRSRGENDRAEDATSLKLGSSPLTRGKPRRRRDVERLPGLIPAHAGKTAARPRSGSPRRAHPRSRGENINLLGGAGAAAGSSPLTRGKHFLTCAFIAQIDQILESLELCAFSESYSSQNVYATDAPRDRVRSIGLAPRSSRGAS